MLITFGRADTATNKTHRHRPSLLNLRKSGAGTVGAGIMLATAGCAGDGTVLGTVETGPPVETPKAAYAIISEGIKERFGQDTEVGAIALHRDDQNSRPGSYYFAVAYRTDGNDDWYLIKSDFKCDDSNTLRRAVKTGTQITSGIDMDFGSKPRGTINHGVDVNVNKKSGALQIKETGTGANWKKTLSSGKKGQSGDKLSLTSRLQTMNNDGHL